MTSVTRTVVNCIAVFIDYFLISLDTIFVYRFYMNLSSLDVVICLLNLLSSCFGEEIGVSLK